MVANMDQLTMNMTKAYEDMNQMSQDNMNAMMQSARIFSDGWQEIMNNVNKLMTDMVENNVNNSKAMLTAKSLTDAVNMQTNLLKDTSTNMMNSVSQLSEISARIAQDSMNPVAEQMNAAMAKMAQASKAA